jgi:hypothetical protein
MDEEDGYRLALGAGGREETRRRNGKDPKPRKARKTRRVPTCPLHPVLARCLFGTYFQTERYQLRAEILFVQRAE